MSKRKLSPLITAMNIVDALDDRDRANLLDYLRSRNGNSPKSTVVSARPSSSTKSGAKGSTRSTKTTKDDAGGAPKSPVEELAAATGRSVEDAQAALNANGGNKKDAMLALTSVDR